MEATNPSTFVSGWAITKTRNKENVLSFVSFEAEASKDETY